MRRALGAAASAPAPSGPEKPAPGTSTQGRATPGPPTPSSATPGTLTSGSATSGSPVSGASASGTVASRTVSSGTPTSSTPTSGTPASDTPTPGTPTSGTPTSSPPAPKPPAPGARPADIAREALRAARAKARQDEADAAGPDAGPGRASPRAAGRRIPAAGTDPTLTRRSRSGPLDRGAARERARDVREFLAGAFRMPSEDDAPASTAPTTADAVAEHGDVPAPAADRAPDGPSPARALPDESRLTSTSTSHPSPRSMAAPSRDGDHRRTFPAFPPLPGAGGDADARFAETWWGHAWVAALEEGALDVKRLARGRGYAQQGHVDAITVTPGLVLAYVQGSRPRPYRVQVRLRTLEDDDWERFLDAAVERPAHIAALLDKEMPESLADCGVPLLPGPGELDPHCSCPDRGHPCKHAAALCYQTARLLDADPFVLLLLRGRGERELLDALSRRNATRAARAAQEQEPAPLPGIRASEAVALSRDARLPSLPPPLPAPPHPGQPPAYPSVPNGPDSFALDQLATDAATRAHALLATGRDEIGELTLWQDAVRLAAARPGSGLTAGTRSLYASLASAAGRTPSELARAVAAWRQGGPDGLTVLEEPWDPPAGRFDRARPQLLAADLPAFRPWRNHLTHPRGHVQLRLGRDGLWYAYESEPGHDDWWPRGTPDPDPVGALTGLGGNNEL
ncbi:SWIM zinc finger family protein [Streptomyces sp. NPDC096132]|uniref:SWIM zinc finger family protein n=1 Tax=Streptomyces sp. NPDC096132 TaxID=3366075 RepID=UPI0037FC1B20